MPLHTCKGLVLSQGEPQHISNYPFPFIWILDLCCRSLYCEQENKYLLIRYCQNHNHITFSKVMEKQNGLAMPITKKSDNPPHDSPDELFFLFDSIISF